MVDISIETAEQTDRRLREVIRSARLKVYPDAHAWFQFPLAQFRECSHEDALALVRDDEVWSQLLPTDRRDVERFTVFRFEFPAVSDNSGFVGWLASLLKAKFGTGVFVTCGCNDAVGGVFDYWGAPHSIREPVLRFVRTLASGQDPQAPRSTGGPGLETFA